MPGGSWLILWAARIFFSALSYRNTLEVCYNVAMKKTDPAVGLSEQEAAKREKNIIRDESKQSYKSIFLQNTFTF
ncbi:MAG TPA: hypothetical protein DCP49_10695, partial [Erysipelotrichaceae bacterium]|nr:hypothetical protein [Erysipelotrichaceae bacterium]